MNAIHHDVPIHPPMMQDAWGRERFNPFTPGNHLFYRCGPVVYLYVHSIAAVYILLTPLNTYHLYNIYMNNAFSHPHHHHPPFTTIYTDMDRVNEKNPDWYAKYTFNLREGLDCCSTESISFHYVKGACLPARCLSVCLSLSARKGCIFFFFFVALCRCFVWMDVLSPSTTSRVRACHHQFRGCRCLCVSMSRVRSCGSSRNPFPFSSCLSAVGACMHVCMCCSPLQPPTIPDSPPTPPQKKQTNKQTQTHKKINKR